MNLDVPREHFWFILNHRGVLVTTCSSLEEAEDKARRWSKRDHYGPKYMCVIEARRVAEFRNEEPVPK